MPRRKSKPYRNGRVHVLSEKCSTCIFRPGNLMHLEPGRVKGMVDASLRNDTAIVCHDTLNGAQAVCRGFFDLHWRDTLPLRAAVALKVLEEVER